MLRRTTCRSIRDLLPLHAGGDLTPDEAARVDGHLHACLSCFREFREHATMRGRLGVLAEEPLPQGVLDGFTEEVMARIAVDAGGPAAELPAARRVR
ncbi:MAG: zf-HC2 domain-containing protein, partial [Planctomycetes bacterium]|nr:zf-HC2 domain-containing protein [Planctomycetota bacterium]